MSRTELFRLALAEIGDAPMPSYRRLSKRNMGLELIQGTSPFFVQPCKTWKG